MNKIAISASLKFANLIRQAILDLEKVGVLGVFPNLDSGVSKEDITLRFLQRVEGEHFEAIGMCEALYIICPGGYVGTLVSVEIGYACAQNKPVIFSEKPSDLGLQALASGYIGLDEIHKLKEL
ncbi:hypothetical protein KAZ57_00465 [Patescibacteria group bacterium]|nr:hypothetical protein [Patescibacteria group bacterium]